MPNLTTEPARLYAVVVALWALVTAICAAAGVDIPAGVDTAVLGLIAALLGTDLRARVWPDEHVREQFLDAEHGA